MGATAALLIGTAVSSKRHRAGGGIDLWSAGRLGDGARDGGQAGGGSGTVVTETSRVLTRAAVQAALAHDLRSAGGET